MSEQKLHCWWGKHDVPRSGFAPNYLKPTYSMAGRICRECSKKRSERNRELRKQKRQEQEFFYGIRF